MISAAALASASGGRVPARASSTAAAESATSFSVPGYLSDVAALSPTNAWAVGYSGGTTERTLIVHWNGTKWSQVTNPKPVTGYLSGIAGAPDDMWAVGATESASGANQHVLIMHWNGKAWRQAAGVPTVKGALNAVSVAGNEVWAVGGTMASPLLTLHRVGDRWYVVPTSSPYARLWSVTATGHDSAWATGITYPASGGYFTGSILLRWSGSIWQQTGFPLQGADNGLIGLATGPGGAVWAVGYYHNSKWTVVAPLSMLWNGKTWRKVTDSGPADGVLEGVSFVPGGGAWAVGSKALGLDTLALHWTGRAWSQIPSPDPYPVSQLFAVAGTSASDVWVVGTGVPKLSAPDQTLTIILHWDGKAWN